MDSYCTDHLCRQSGARHLHAPYTPKPSPEQRITELERTVDLITVQIVKLWNRLAE